MKVRDLLAIQAIAENRKTPSDINDDNLEVKYYSSSKGSYMSILDMDLIHLVRAFHNSLNSYHMALDDDYFEQWKEQQKRFKEHK